MNVYAIHFVGYNPVGAVAVATAESTEGALKVFRQRLILDFPDLIPRNWNVNESNVQSLWEGFPEALPSCHILSNGDY